MSLCPTKSELDCLPTVLNAVGKSKGGDRHNHALVDVIFVISTEGPRINAKLSDLLGMGTKDQAPKPLLIKHNEQEFATAEPPIISETARKGKVLLHLM